MVVKRSFKKKSSTPYAIKNSKAIPYLVKSVKKLKKNSKRELKFIESGVVSLTPSTTATITYLSASAQGTTNVGREGNVIYVKSMYFRGTCIQHVSALTTVIRFLIVMDKDNQGAAPITTDILDSSDVNSQTSKVNTKRFRILTDKTMTMDTASNNLIKYKFYHRMNRTLYYKGTSAAASDGLTNAIYVLILSNQAVNTPSFAYSSRIRFTD